MIGAEIGRYKIVERLGAGGMGEVYRAEDTTLGRHVALKFLAAHLLNDDEAKQRFLREARAAAAVRHPNICHVHEVAKENGKTFLAMDYLEGESLEDRIRKGPLLLKDTLDIGRQIAEGLEAAHDSGVVHRDIKPANIMVDAKGRATILDFGLARLTEASKLTRADQTVGTAAYMSPEQIQGAEVDHRADIWALGVVLYEMTAGQRPFKGQYDQALAYEIVHEQPDPLTGIRTGVRVGFEAAIAKCLAKDPTERYQSIAELLVDIKVQLKKLESGVKTAPASTIQPAAELASEPPEEVTRLRFHRKTLAAALAVSLALVGFFAFRSGEDPPARPLRKFSFSHEAESLRPNVSPDGRYVAYHVLAGGNTVGVWVLDLTTGQAERPPNTTAAGSVAWAPASPHIALQERDGSITRIDVRDGASQTIVEVEERVTGLAWRSDGQFLLFSTEDGIFEVSARGGESRILLETTEYDRIDLLDLVAGYEDLVLLEARKDGRNKIILQDLESKSSWDIALGTLATYSTETGHVLYYNGSYDEPEIWALPFSMELREATGDPFRVAQGGRASLSLEGTLVLEAPPGSGRERLVVRNRQGKAVGYPGKPQGRIVTPQFAPDDSRVATWSTEQDPETGISQDIWSHETARPVSTRLTGYRGREDAPVWSPTGREFAFTGFLSGGPDVYVRAVEAAGGGPELLLGGISSDYPTDWSRDGRYLALVRVNAGSDQAGIWYFERKPDGTWLEPQPFETSLSIDEREAMFSPDGKYLLYTTNETGRDEIYIREFPGGGGKRQVSTEGGVQPTWRADGREVYYFEGETLLAVPVSAGDVPRFGKPVRLFDDPTALRRRGQQYDVSEHGQRFVMVEVLEPPPPPSINIIQNWYEEFRDRGRN